jgi:hypothetical protein
VLESEAGIPPIANHLDEIQARTRIRLQASGQSLLIQEACSKIRLRLQQQRGRRRTPRLTPRQRKELWTNEILKNQGINIKTTRRLERTALDLAQLENAMKATKAIKKHSYICW